MGRIEKEIRKKERVSEIQNVILGIVGTAGILAVSIMAPNLFGGLKKLGLLPKRRRKETIDNSRTRLIKRGLLRYEGRHVVPTRKGEIALGRWKLRNYKIQKPKRWDKKWRVLIFDIAETRKHIRDDIRNSLKKMGLYKLQNSVWAYPYDCEDYTTMLKADSEIGKSLLYMVVDKIEYDIQLKRFFGL